MNRHVGLRFGATLILVLSCLAASTVTLAQTPTAGVDNVAWTNYTNYDHLTYDAWATGPSGNVGTTWYILKATFYDSSNQPVGPYNPDWPVGYFQRVYSDDISTFPNDGVHYSFAFDPDGPDVLQGVYNTFFHSYGATHAIYHYEIHSADETTYGSIDAEFIANTLSRTVNF